MLLQPHGERSEPAKSQKAILAIDAKAESFVRGMPPPSPTNASHVIAPRSASA